MRKLIVVVILFVSFAVSKASAGQGTSEGPLTVLTKVVGCSVIGVPTCALISQDDLSLQRSIKNFGFQISYLPSYAFDLSYGKGYQRFEGHAYWSNVIVAGSYRSSFSGEGEFSSQSVRVGYSFDWKTYRPAIGLGARSNVNSPNKDALELWLPVFADWNQMDHADLGFMIETLWIFGQDDLRAEIQGRVGYKITDHFLWDFGMGYFVDYDGPGFELSFGPMIYF